MSDVHVDGSISQTIARSPADLLRVVVAVTVVVLVILIEWLFGDALVGFVSDLLSGLAAVPQWIIDVLVGATRIISIVVLIGGLLWTIVRSGMRMLITVAIGIGLAIVLAVLLGDVSDVTDGATSIGLSSGLGPLTAATFPTVFGIAAMAGALTSAAPWLSRRWRRWGWLAVLGLVVTRFVTTPAAFDSFESALSGWLGGAAALVVLGAPSRRATAAGVMRSLAAVGLPLESLEAAGVDARGSTPYLGAGPDGSRYFVKALGQDQRSADLLFRMYRGLQRKDLGDERPFSSLRRAVEHEAFVALAARDLGTRTPRIRGFALAEPNTFVLAYDAVAGRSLDRLEPDQITDEVLQAIWRQLAHLRAHRIAHRDLRLANLFLADDGVVWMIDFGFSEVAASDLLLANDVAELVASSSVVVGAERAMSHARATVDADTLQRTRDRLQLWALSGATRTAIKERPGLLDDLRARLTSP
jgi:tRNA A-37 threonylcarbamoyl transferase component Bud32